MVYFECQKCNESIKKPKVAAHMSCCGSHYVTCIDCSKVFGWNEWDSHNSCISEAQKYQGNLYQAKESSNKGQVKQDAWMDNVIRKIEDPNSGIPQQTKALMERLLGFSNIPRKQKPFANFVKNSVKIWEQKKIDDMWEVIASANAKPAQSAASADASKNVVEQSVTTKPVKWQGWKRAMDDELKAAGGEMPWKKLRDELVVRFQSSGQVNGASKDQLELQALASIPDTYCSKDDPLVRLPKSK